MYLFSNKKMLTAEEIQKESNQQLLHEYAMAHQEWNLSQGDYHDYDDCPIADNFNYDDVELISEYEDRLRAEIFDRLEDDAKLNRMNALNDSLSEIQSSMKAFTKSGLNTEVMVYWIHHNSDLNITQVRKMLKKQNDFFRKMFF